MGWLGVVHEINRGGRKIEQRAKEFEETILVLCIGRAKRQMRCGGVGFCGHANETDVRTKQLIFDIGFGKKLFCLKQASRTATFDVYAGYGYDNSFVFFGFDLGTEDEEVYPDDTLGKGRGGGELVPIVRC
ncbi:hypothetical protein CEXT_453701 [Caerostris extrusa]|uniref:Uncharacterized protein n=1 Tax=Caerostris extrusa TaxID=172846 RepID=A0AAV4TIV2_CAEEX|nr:hypothetical protein CEXT_453701 [Caerostris extrusa]